MDKKFATQLELDLDKNRKMEIMETKLRGYSEAERNRDLAVKTTDPNEHHADAESKLRAFEEARDRERLLKQGINLDKLRSAVQDILESISELDDDEKRLESDKAVGHLIQKLDATQQACKAQSLLALRSIRLHHPLLSRLTFKAFQFIMDNSFFFKLKTGQRIYREGAEVTQNIYVIMYGLFKSESAENGQFGALMHAGHTFGEEALFLQSSFTENECEFPSPKLRAETVEAVAPSCVLQISKQNLELLARLKDRSQNEGTTYKDFVLLKYVLNEFLS